MPDALALSVLVLSAVEVAEGLRLSGLLGYLRPKGRGLRRTKIGSSDVAGVGLVDRPQVRWQQMRGVGSGPQFAQVPPPVG